MHVPCCRLKSTISSLVLVTFMRRLLSWPQSDHSATSSRQASSWLTEVRTTTTVTSTNSLSLEPNLPTVMGVQGVPLGAENVTHGASCVQAEGAGGVSAHLGPGGYEVQDSRTEGGVQSQLNPLIPVQSGRTLVLKAELESMNSCLTSPPLPAVKMRKCGVCRT